MSFHILVVSGYSGDRRARSLTIICLLFAVMLNFSAFASPQLLKPDVVDKSDWNIQTVDSSGRIRIDVSLALDSRGLPRISYYDEMHQDPLDGDLMYSTWMGTSWSIETVDSEGDVGAHDSLALDSRDFPHIAYFDNANLTLKYARWNGSVWNIETADSGDNVGKYASIAVDSHDHPHISYRARIEVGGVAHYDLRHAWWNGSAWSIETVDTYVCRETSIAIDSNDYPHISYCRDQNLKYAVWTGSAWMTEIVDSQRRAGNPSSLALDSQDFPHIGYYDGANEDLKYAMWNGSAWSIETVDTTGYVGRKPSLALDGHDYPHISYQDGDSYLKYTWWNGTAWSFEIVDNIDAVGDSISMAVDGDDQPHIAYNTWSRNLKYATKARLLKPRASLDIDPDTLNLNSKGRWITAYLTTENARAEDVGPSSILLDDIIPPAWWNIQSNTTLMVKFDRAEVESILPVSNAVDIKITGQWKDGEVFELHDIIRVIDVGGHRESPLGMRSMEDVYGTFGSDSLSIILQEDQPTVRDLVLRPDQFLAQVTIPAGEGNRLHDSSEMRQPESYLLTASSITVSLI